MNKKIFRCVALATLLFTLAGFGCAEADAARPAPLKCSKSKKYKIKADRFTGIELGGSFDFEYEAGEQGFHNAQLTLIAPPEIRDLVKFSLDGKTMVVTADPKISNYDLAGQPLVVKLKGVMLKDMKFGGSGAKRLSGNLTISSAFELEAGGSGPIEALGLKVNANKIDMELGGSVRTMFNTLSASEVEIECGGSVMISAEGVAANDLEINAAGSSMCDLKGIASEDVEVNVAGSATTRLGGNCDDLSLSVAGSAKVNAGELKAAHGRASAAGSAVVVCNVRSLKESVAGTANITNKR